MRPAAEQHGRRRLLAAAAAAQVALNLITRYSPS
jgi:hypothetical protein